MNFKGNPINASVREALDKKTSHIRVARQLLPLEMLELRELDTGEMDWKGRSKVFMY